jgi:hypothetical protein
MTTPVVLITGALTGIGRATALATTQSGARLIEKDFKNGYANDQRRYCYEFTSC